MTCNKKILKILKGDYKICLFCNKKITLYQSTKLTTCCNEKRQDLLSDYKLCHYCEKPKKKVKDEMYCNEDIHMASYNDSFTLCPSCTTKINDCTVNKNISFPCCDNQELINDNDEFICKNCGEIQRYILIPRWYDVYDNMFKIRRKSIYQRKYHIEKKINIFFV